MSFKTTKKTEVFFRLFSYSRIRTGILGKYGENVSNVDISFYKMATTDVDIV